jgi:hypothetical protein
MISTDGGITAPLFPLHPHEFNCFDPIDEEGTNADSLDDKPEKSKKSKSTLFDVTGYGADTFLEPETDKQKKATKKTAAKKNASDDAEPLEEYTAPQRRVELLTRPYEPSDFDKNTMTFSHPSDFDIETLTFKREGKAGPKDSRPKWTPPAAANDNHSRKHSWPALDEARNNTLIKGRDGADTLIKNEWAFDVIMEISELLDAAAPKSAWLQHSSHGETDEHKVEDNANPGYGADVKHDYGPSEKKVKRLWEYGNDNEPSKEGDPWNLGTVEKLIDVVSEPSNKIVKALHKVGALEMNELNHVTHFPDKKGNWLKFKTKTRGAKGKRLHPKVIPDPKDTHEYDDAALPRNKKGELTVGFFGGKTGSSNSVKPDTMDYEPIAGPSNSFSDPWAAEIAAEKARDDATIKLSQCRLLVGDLPYEALTQAASGLRIGELCDGRLGNTTDSAKGRSLLQVAIERIIEDRTRNLGRSKKAA